MVLYGCFLVVWNIVYYLEIIVGVGDVLVGDDFVCFVF